MAIKTRNVVYNFKTEVSGQENLDRLIKEMNQAEQVYENATEGSLEWLAAQKKLVQISKELGKEVTTNTKQVSSWEQTMKKAGNAILALGGIATVGALTADATTKLIDFDQALADLSAITGATGGDLDFLTNRAREFGRQTTVSATDAVEAFKLVASAKPDLLTNAEALATVTGEAITLAEASGLALPEAAANLGSALNALNLDADESGRIINVLAAASQKGAREIPFITEAFSKFGGVAAQAGESIETSAAAVEILGAKIPEAATVGTNLRGVLVKLQVAAEAEGRTFQGLTEELGLYADKVNDITFLKQVFGEENLLAAQTLIAERSALEGLEEAITGTNAAYEQAETRTATLSGAIQRLRNNYTDLILRFSGSTGAAAKAIQFLAENLGTIVKVIGSLTAGIVAYRVAVIAANNAQVIATAVSNAYRIAKIATTSATRAATLATRAFNVAVKANPVGLIIGVLTTAVALLWDWGDAAEDAADKQRELNAAVTEGQRLASSSQDLRQQAAVLDQLNKGQLESFLQRVEQEIAASEEKRTRLLAIEETIAGGRNAIAEDYARRLAELDQQIAATGEDPALEGRRNQLLRQRLELRREETRVLDKLPTVTSSQSREEGITKVQLDASQRRLEAYRAEAQARLRALGAGTGADGGDVLSGSIAALQADVSRLRDKVVKETQIGSEEFADAIEEYVAASAKLQEVQKNLRGVEDAAPDDSIKALSARVAELRAELETTSASSDDFDALVTSLKRAQEELNTLQARIRSNGPSDNSKAELTDLSEAERNQLALAQIVEEGELRILDIKLAFAKARLQILKESGRDESAEYQRQVNKIEELEAQRVVVVQNSSDEQAAADKAKTDVMLAGIQEVLNAAINAANTLIQIKVDEVTQLIGLQEERVRQTLDIAEQGNAEILQREEERLDDLNKQREEYVRKQQALAAVQLVAESALAIARAAAAGGPAAPFTIAATLIALAAGLAQARALASQSAFFKGGYTGDGSPYGESTAVGPRPYIYHNKEFVMDHVATGIGKNKEYFQWILDGRVDLEKAFNSRNVIVNSQGINEGKIDELIYAINSKPVTSFNFDKRGIVHVVKESTRKAKRLKSRTS